MKKLFIGLTTIVGLVFIAAYFFIPQQLNIAKVSIVNRSSETIYRFLSNPNNWKKWWPDTTHSSQQNSLIYEEISYTIINRQHNSFEILMNNAGDQISSTLQIIPLPADSSAIEWRSIITCGNSPINKIKQYRRAVKIKKNMEDVLAKLDKFLEVIENIYGMKIIQTSTKDTFLIATKTTLTSYPSTNVIYSTIMKLQKFLSSNNAAQTGKPLLNITQLNNSYEMMVALPTNIKLTPTGDIFFRRMVPGNFLVTDVYGGDHTVQQALTTVQHYMTDNKRTGMAIPFQSLVTDRSKEPDTLKWLTRIYYPVK